MLVPDIPRWLLALAIALAGITPASAATFSLEQGEDGFDFIYIEGEIAVGDEDHFRRLAVGSDRAAVVLGSPGGALVPALEIGKTIQLKGFATYVPNEVECTSACALIWIAGSPRYLSNSSRVGFHASYRDVDGRLEEAGVANAMVGRYLTLLNLPERAIIFATSASPTSVSWLSQGNASTAGIDFEVVDLQERSTSTEEAVARPVATSSDDEGFRWEEGSWSVWTSSEDETCGVMQAFTSERGVENFSSVAAVVPWSGDEALFVFSNEKFRSTVTGQTYEVEIAFLKRNELDTGWGIREFTANGEILRTWLSWADLEPDLRVSDTVAFFKDGDVIDTFSLEGSSKALDQLRACRKQGENRLDDPFVR